MLASRKIVLVTTVASCYAWAMPNTVPSPSHSVPAYVCCTSCIYWVPVTEVSDAGECKDCWLDTNDWPF